MNFHDMLQCLRHNLASNTFWSQVAQSELCGLQRTDTADEVHAWLKSAMVEYGEIEEITVWCSEWLSHDLMALKAMFNSSSRFLQEFC